MLLEEVWNYKFVPATNLVDVHMGRLRHKVDGPDDAPMIQNVRGAGLFFAPRSSVLEREVPPIVQLVLQELRRVQKATA